jgi:hypothetical protein
MNTEDYQTTRIWKKTLQALRFIHAFTGESIVSILDRLVQQELERIKAHHEEKTASR